MGDQTKKRKISPNQANTGGPRAGKGAPAVAAIGATAVACGVNEECAAKAATSQM
jgi:hypothetical protein